MEVLVIFTELFTHTVSGMVKDAVCPNRQIEKEGENIKKTKAERANNFIIGLRNIGKDFTYAMLTI